MQMVLSSKTKYLSKISLKFLFSLAITGQQFQAAHFALHSVKCFE